MPDNILFYIVFLSQILLASFYFPRKILGRVRSVMEQYPPSKYPRLYSKPIDFYEKGQRNYRKMNQIILVVGFVLMFAVGLWDYSSDGWINQIFPFAYFMVQVIPLVLMEKTESTLFKLMKEADLRTTRKAELHPRRLFDFISPAIVGLAIFMNVACIWFYLYRDQYQFHWGSDAFVISITLIAMNALFAGIIFRNLHGKKLDPYQASKDRIRQIGVTVKSLFFMSIGASVFIMMQAGINEFDLDYLEPSIMSLYLQFTMLIGLGAVLRKLRIENINFDVYRGDTTAT
jgi:hypothetical protein